MTTPGTEAGVSVGGFWPCLSASHERLRVGGRRMSQAKQSGVSCPPKGIRQRLRIAPTRGSHRAMTGGCSVPRPRECRIKTSTDVGRRLWVRICKGPAGPQVTFAARGPKCPHRGSKANGLPTRRRKRAALSNGTGHHFGFVETEHVGRKLHALPRRRTLSRRGKASPPGPTATPSRLPRPQPTALARLAANRPTSARISSSNSVSGG